MNSLQTTSTTKIANIGNNTYDRAIASYYENFDALTYDNILTHMESIKHTSASNQTVHKFALKKACKMSTLDITEKAVIDSAFTEIKTPPVDHTIREEQILAPELVRSMLKVANDKERLIIHALYITATRISELCNMKLTDCDVRFDGVRIKVIGKGKRPRWVMLPTDVYLDIREVFESEVYLFETVNGNPYRRQYVYRLVNRIGKKATGRNDIHPHTLRHSFATNKLKDGMSLKAISNYLGHASTAITADFYIHDQLTIDDIATI
jgi:integrase/recombinase XerD